MAKKSKTEDIISQLDRESTVSEELTSSEVEVQAYVNSDVEIQLDSNVRELSAAEQFFLESHRNYTDEEIGEVLQLDKDFVQSKRMELQVTFEEKKPSVVDLLWNPKLYQWEDKEGNVYNGPTVNVDDVKEIVETKKQVVAGITAGDLIGRNEKKSAAVMTAGASQMSDITKGATQRLIPSCVHQPKKTR